MVVGTIGAGVPEEVLLAAGAEVVPIVGRPGDGTELADLYVEPMVGERARSQLQRVLDGTYEHVDLIVFSREEDAPLRLFYVLREVRRLEPERRIPGAPPARHPAPANRRDRRWNEERVRELAPSSAPTTPRSPRRSPRRRAPNESEACRGRRRVYVTGARTPRPQLGAAVEAAGAAIVEGRPVPTDARAPAGRGDRAPARASAARPRPGLERRARVRDRARTRPMPRRRRGRRVLPRARRRAALGVPGAAGGARASAASR